MQEHIKQQEKREKVAMMKTNLKDLTALIDRDVAMQIKTKKLIAELKKHYDK